uniref:Zinc transporter ZIP9 n=1 Tax=Panagrellus redivivus TaxID=6233 RepID=A0A7E4W563_PANRE
MFAGSYAAGFLPLAFSFSESKIRLLSILGAGLLVGTALAVILPEGIEVLQDSQIAVAAPIHHHQQQAQQQHLDNHAAKNILEQNTAEDDLNPPRIVPKDAEMNPDVPLNVDAQGDTDTQVRVKRDDVAHSEVSSLTGEQIPEEAHQHKSDIGPVVGWSLIAGFLLMLFVEQVTKHNQSGRQKITATIGLVVHSAVDGIALGSASMVNKSDVQFIVFIAIMLHKAPAAFGLVTILMMEGLERAKIRKHLFVFASAAPIGALATFFLMPKDPSVANASSASTGIMLLFSAGTFLYVATVHVLPELAASSNKQYRALPTAGNTSTTPHSHSGADFSLKELIVFSVGSVLPLLLSAGHHH